MEPILVSKKDAAAALAVSIRTIDNLIYAKKLIVRRFGGRTLVVRSSLERLARGDVPNPTALALAARRVGQ